MLVAGSAQQVPLVLTCLGFGTCLIRVLHGAVARQARGVEGNMPLQQPTAPTTMNYHNPHVSSFLIQGPM